MYPPGQPSENNPNPRFPTLDEIHHASPRIIGTPMSSNSSPLKNSSMSKVVKPAEVTPTGPEKPQRQYSYHEESPQFGNERSAKASTTSRVRFQDIDSNEGADQTNKIELQLEQLRLSSVEREFRKRIAEYNTGNGINGNGDSGSDTEDRRRLPPSTAHGNTHLGHFQQNVGTMLTQNKFDQNRNRKIETRKKRTRVRRNQSSRRTNFVKCQIEKYLWGS